METTGLIKQAADATGKVMSGLSTDHRDSPTPCSEFNVHDLASHMAGFFAGSASAARKDAERPAQSPEELLAGDPARSLPDLAARMADAWQGRGALEGTTRFGPGDMDAGMAATITFFETLVHGWDLARGTGQAIEVGPELAQAALETARQICNEHSRQRGAFGPEVAAPADAGPFEKALALSGRDPAWTA